MSIEVKLELGHRGVLRDKKTVEGFTHDWTVFVRGEEGSQIDFFVEKVVFHLHESFPKPKRVLKEPPYSVSESGYAGFIMPIDVYFRTREEPRKVTFKYDLYLRLEGPPVSNLRIEKLTFQNPSPDFRGKLIKAGGLAGALTGSAAGGSASLSTQACVPPQNVEDHQANNPKPTVAEKKPRSHVPSKDLPSKPPPSLPAPPSTAVHPKPSQPFTDIFGAPIRTKSSPDSTSVKSKDSGHSSQTKKVPSSNSSSSNKDIKPSLKDKESHKSKDSHHANKEPHHLSKETNLSKDAHQSKDTTIIKKSPHQKDCIPLSSKDSNVSKESHHSTKEKRPPKEHHLKEGHKNKDSHHTPKEKPPKESRSHSESKDSKPSKPIKSEKEASKSSSVKRPANTDSHSSHGNVEKKKKSSPASSESSEKSNNHSKHKIKENKNKSEKHKNKSHSHPIKKEEEKSKHKSSPAPQPKTPPEPKEPLKPKANSPFKAPSPAVIKPPSPPPKPPSPPPIVKAPSPVIKPPSPDSSSMDSDSDESHKSYYNKAQYSSPASSISESSLPGSHPIAGLISDHSILSPLSNEDSDSSPSVPKHKLSSDYDLDGSPEYKPLENKPMPKLKKKHHSHHKSSYKSKSSDNYHQGNGSISNDIPMHHSPNFEYHKNFMNNSAYRQELLELQRIIMTSEDRKLLQYIVDLIEETGKYEVTNTTFDFDLCSLDPAIIHKIKLYLQNCDKYISH